jgi:hypothetical protein
MAFTFNPLTFKSQPIENTGQRQLFLASLGDALFQIVSYITNPKAIAQLLSGNNLLLAGALSNSLNDLGSPAGNSTVDTKQAAITVVRVSWTTAANWQLTLNNLAQGALVYLRLVNNSGASRTFTVLGNTPASVAYGISMFSPTNNALSSGVTVASAAAVNAFGVTYTAAAAPALHMVGSIG